MDEARQKRRARARARRERLERLAREGGPDAGGLVDKKDDRPPALDDVHARVALVRVLSERAWALSGRPWPEYTRETMPGRVLRRKK